MLVGSKSRSFGSFPIAVLQDASMKAFLKSGDVLPLLMTGDDALQQSSLLKKPGFEEVISIDSRSEVF